jgi:hypothetical protein
MEYLLGPMSGLADQPWIGLLPALVLAALFLASRRRLVLVVAVLWLLYVPYEYGMKLHILCSGECNIRIDLLAIYPVLAVATIVALVVGLRAARKMGPPGK